MEFGNQGRIPDHKYLHMSDLNYDLWLIRCALTSCAI